MSSNPTSEEIALQYVEQLPWPPYPFQEQAIFTWFDCEDGMLICAPTGTGKTVIAETALYEALQLGKKAYYTTPLIALTDQKFAELQKSVQRWGFPPETVGLVTGNRKVNPDAPILVVVAEILLNRLLDPDFSFDDVSAVVMDEFHSFNDPERGIVWELSLGMLPLPTRVLLISATVGNAPEFVGWLNRHHNRKLRLLQSNERKVPLTFRWVIDQLLPEHLELMAAGEEENRYTPALVFCFNRSECWSVAEQLKGRRLLAEGQQKQLQTEIAKYDWSVGVGGKLKQILIRGVGIHHAGLLPRYRRVVERLFQQKLLSVCVCTETLAAGINLPARSVVMTSLLKGPRGGLKVIDASSAQQMFGRAGRPQFDDKGFVYAVAHEDDVRLHRWQEKYDQIPEDTKDPGLRRAKKNLKKKMPKKRPGQQYWTEAQFEMLQTASAGKLASKGRFPWRLLAFLIRRNSAVGMLQSAVRRRLMDSKEVEISLRTLKRMLITLEAGGFIRLSPEAPHHQDSDSQLPACFSSRLLGQVSLDIDQVQEGRSVTTSVWGRSLSQEETMGDVIDFSEGFETPADFGGGLFEDESQPENFSARPSDQPANSSKTDNLQTGDSSADSMADDASVQQQDSPGLLGQLIQEARTSGQTSTTAQKNTKQPATSSKKVSAAEIRVDGYEPITAEPTPLLDLLFAFRSINSIYAVFLAEHMHKANYEERLQLLEAALDMPMSVARSVRVPFPDKMPHGPLATEYLDSELLTRGLVTQEELNGYRDDVLDRNIPPLKLADKLHTLFRAEFPGIHDARCTAVWCIGDLLQFGGDFNKYVKARDLTKQEGIIFRHCLRMILLCGEFAQIEPPGMDPQIWRNELAELAALLTDSCRQIDPDSTDETLHQLDDRIVDTSALQL